MKKLFTAVLHHLQQSFSIKTYGLCFVTIALACWLNYSNDFSLWPGASSFTGTFLFLSVLFLVFFLLGFAFTVAGKKVVVQKNHYGWILFIAPFVFALKVALPFDVWFLSNVSAVYQNAFHKAVDWLCGLLFIIPVLMILYYFYEKKWNLYFIKKTNSFRPYLLLLLCMVPLLLFAVWQPAFQAAYPRSKDVTMSLGDGAGFFHYFVFELCYALDFITIELFFRGLLIATLSRVLGVHALVPVALFYFSIHLGKPMLEAISSFFGGLILGAVSYETKSIWGGWMVHCGIALFMELMAHVF